MDSSTFLKPRVTKRAVCGYRSLAAMAADMARKTFVPPRRVKVSEWAATDRQVHQPGAYIGPWKNETTPYMVEPMDTTQSPEHKGLIFVGPAQSAKTDALLVNWLGYAVTTDPMDMILYSPSFTASRDFSMRRVDRLHRHSPSVGENLVQARDADNKFDKHYKSGMMLTLSHPSVNEMSGKPCGRVALTDYDRMPEDIGGEGNGYDLAAKRTTTFGSYAMALAESSPSRPITDLKHVVTGHAAPPTTGILALYNRGDRRRWHWPCPHCGTYFEGLWAHIKWDEDQRDNLSKADTVYMEPPCCGRPITPDMRYKMNTAGRWVREGQTVLPSGEVVGEGRKSDIASFWLLGPAAALNSWRSLVKSYLDAEDEYNSSGEETALQKFFNTDLALPYIPKKQNLDHLRTPEDLEARCVPWGTRRVPAGVRFLIAVADVQKNMFVVQVFGIAPGVKFDIYLVDRFQIRYSLRPDESAPEGQESYLWVKPGSYLEDWDLLTAQVLDASYELDDDSGRRMGIKMTFCDSGGRAGVTTNAYDYYRRLKKAGYGGRFHLVKGEANPSAPRAQVRWPDADRKSHAGARGEIPVLFLNPTINKDDLDNRLDVVVPGHGMIHWPSWLIEEKMTFIFGEMTAEVREAGKGWEKKGRHNEAWDLFYYLIGGCVSSLIGIEKIDWDNPPSWAGPWDVNPFVFEAEAATDKVTPTAATFDWGSFGRNLG